MYTGVTSNLIKRIYQHKHETNNSSFSSKYGCKNLTYFESFETMEQAIIREKQIKDGSRKKKVELIESMNPEWMDLYESVCEEV